MANLETDNICDIQKIEDLVGDLENIENDLGKFGIDVETGLLNGQVEQAKGPEKGKFLNGHESKDKKYMVYEYTIKKSGTPKAIRAQAVKQGIAKETTGIQITNSNLKEYQEGENFKAGDKVYVRVPKTPGSGKDKKEQGEKNGNKTDLKIKPIDLQYDEINVEKQPHAKLYSR